MRIPHARPDITAKDINAVAAVLKTPFLARGPKLAEFEEKIARYVGVRHGISVNSGTSALHLIVKAMGIGPGDMVITTPLSFIASSNCLLFEGAIPVFVDIDQKTAMIDSALVEEKAKKLRAAKKPLKAILAVDLFGSLAAWNDLRRIAKRYGLFLIEDSAQALGTYAMVRGKKHMAGTFGDAGIFAFFPNKQITTGEGGMVVTDDAAIAKRVRMLRNYGREKGGYYHTILGYNFHLSDINCALGIAQLTRIEEIIAKRARIVEWYQQVFAGNNDVLFYAAPPFVRVSWFSAIAILADRFTETQRNAFLHTLAQKGIDCRNYYPPIHLQQSFRQFGYKKGDFPRAESFAAQTIGLPLFSTMTHAQVDYVCAALLNILKVIR
ncbi:MAG: DegT/DnrJ/EryC1/StrS family aminotransferase [Patescibacteria group bacterium]|mgnify:FL=1